jgi:hypothetical protein
MDSTLGLCLNITGSSLVLGIGRRIKPENVDLADGSATCTTSCSQSPVGIIQNGPHIGTEAVVSKEGL